MIPLTEDHYKDITPLVDTVPFNTLFARAIIDKQTDGKVFVDSIECPRTVYIAHGYGMSLLIGENHNPEFNTALKAYILNQKKDRKIVEWMQVYPEAWNRTLQEMFQHKISTPEKDEDKNYELEILTRVNFKLDENKYHLVRSVISDLPEITIKRTNSIDFETMPGTVVPRFFWKNAEEFLEKGFGFSLFHQEKLATMAFLGYVYGNQFELGIETCEPFRGKGYAQRIAAAYIDHCLQQGIEPAWSCRMENTASYNLAQKLGFEVVRKLPYYKIPL